MPELKRKLDYTDLLASPDDGKRYELVRGGLLVTPAPNVLHQRVSKRLLVALMDYFEGRSIGEVFAAPIDLILTRHDVFVPDLLVVDDPAIVTKRGIEGPPLLVIEILSPSTRDRDRGIKAGRYADLGTRHYWIVDPEARTVECHRLEKGDGAFRLAMTVGPGGRLVDPAWGGLEIDLDSLFLG